MSHSILCMFAPWWMVCNLMQDDKNPTEKLKKLGRVLGWVLVFLSVLFLARQLWLHGGEIAKQPGKFKLLITIFPAGVAYGFFSLLLAVSWYHLLNRVEKSVHFGTIYRIYSRSQIAKYLPGNIFHYGGRQIMGKRVGLKQTSLLMATVYETVLIIVAALLLSAGGSLILGFEGLRQGFILIVGCTMVAIIMFAALLFRWVPYWFPSVEKYLGPLPSYGLRDWSKVVALPLLLYVVFFLLTGGLLLLMSVISFPHNVSPGLWCVFVTLFASAWVAGFITPGAPAGIGVREALITAGLTSYLGASGALTLAIVFRFVTTLGDFSFFLTSYFCRRQNRDQCG